LKIKKPEVAVDVGNVEEVELKELAVLVEDSMAAEKKPSTERALSPEVRNALAKVIVA
jgi:hypothetical protein